MFVRDDTTPAWVPWRGPCPACGVPIRIEPGIGGDRCPACGAALCVRDLEQAPTDTPGFTHLRLVVELA